MYVIKRTSTVPDSPMRVLVDQPAGSDGGFGQGGSFYFFPAGQEGDQVGVGEHVARAIMGDASLAEHFECDPPLPSAVDAAVQSVNESDPDQDSAPATGLDSKPGGTRAVRRSRSTGE